MVRTREGGSVLSFIIIGIVLVGLLVGGIYGLKQLTPQPAPNQPQPEQVGTEEQTPGPESETQPEAAPEHTTEIQPEQDNSSENQSAHLPQSGPANVYSSILALGVISFAVVSYLRSRRAQASFDF